MGQQDGRSKFLIAAVFSGITAIFLPQGHAQEKPPEPVITYNFFLDGGNESLVYEQFDLRTIRSSLNAQLQPGRHTLKQLGVNVSSLSRNVVEFDTGGWNYTLRILRRTDANHDGLEDLLVCFEERSSEGTTPSAPAPYLLTRYERTGPVIALAYRPEGNVCPAPAGKP